MAGVGERLWEIGKSPPHHITVLAFGLFALLTARIATAVGLGAFVAGILAAVGVFFVALALFLGAYTSSGDHGTGVAWRIAQLIAAVVVVLALL
jgi:hypothetical protein